MLDYKQVFKEAMLNKEAKKLSDLRHKATVLFNLLDFDALKAFLEKGNIHIDEDIPSGQLHSIIKQGETLFDEAIEEMTRGIGRLKE